MLMMVMIPPMVMVVMLLLLLLQNAFALKDVPTNDAWTNVPKIVF